MCRVSSVGTDVPTKVQKTQMSGSAKSFMIAVAAVALMSGQAVADDGDFAGGGVLQDGFNALQQELAKRDTGHGDSSLKLVDSTSRTIGFTPRFSGVPIGLLEGVSVDRGSALKTRLDGGAVGRQENSRSMEYAQSHDLGLVKVDLAAIAGYADRGDQNLGQSSTFGFGGDLKFSGLEGLRLGASYDRRDESLGIARDRVTAGLGYDFGTVDTRLSVSNVSQYDVNGVPTDEQQVWVVGGQMELSSSLVVGGDLAYSTNLDGTVDTSGVVNFRFNF